MSISMHNSIQAVSIFSPISIGNVSVGFDNLGLAVTPIDGQLLGDVVHIRASSDTENHLECKGRYQQSLPVKKEENIVWRCLLEFNRYFVEQGGNTLPVHIILDKNTPICSGTGSSACSVVAGLNALNEFYGNPISENKLLELMGKLEAEISGSLHYDNVAPCFLGGLQLMLDDKQRICQSIPVFEDCYWVMSYPDIEVSTRKARDILPKSYSRQEVIKSSQLLAGFIDASYRQDKQQAFSVLRDVIAEPYRVNLLQDYRETKSDLLNNGCLAVGISGSGPTVFAVCDSIEQAEEAKRIFDLKYQKSDNGFTSICMVDTQGARKI